MPNLKMIQSVYCLPVDNKLEMLFSQITCDLEPCWRKTSIAGILVTDYTCRIYLPSSSTRAVHRRHCVGGGAPVNFGRRRRGRPKTVFSKIQGKMSLYPQNFLRNFFSHQSFEVCR